MVGSEIWDKYHVYCSRSGKIAQGEAEYNLPLALQYEWAVKTGMVLTCKQWNHQQWGVGTYTEKPFLRTLRTCTLYIVALPSMVLSWHLPGS